MKIKWQPQGSLGEAVSTRIEMSLVDAKGVGLHPPVRCKDFLSDAYYSEHVKKPVSIWGFNWSPGTFKSNEEVRIAVRRKDYKLGQAEADRMNALLASFKAVGNVMVVPDDAGSLYVWASEQWTSCPWQISLLTLMIRVALSMEEGDERDIPAYLSKFLKKGNDAGDHTWLKGAMPAVEQIMAGKIPAKLAEKTYASYTSSHECHHGGGIYAAWTGKHTG